MRRSLIAAVVAGGALACAAATPPPGGPEDHAAPRLVRVTPDTNAVNVSASNVSFYFDETINDRGSGAQELARRFLISPAGGDVRVSWHRSRIDVRPRQGFRPNTAYSVTMLPGLSDLRGNSMRTGATVVFSTGPTIPTGSIAGTVFDWLAERPAAQALIQAITPDSVRYFAQSDSTGGFQVRPLPAGRYLVRAIVDANGNRDLDRNEAFDSLTVVVPLTAPIELRVALRDTLPPRLLSITTNDSLSLRVTFDRPLDPTQPIAPDNFRLLTADSSVVPIARVLTPSQEAERTRAAQQAVADSMRRADSLAGKVLPPPPRTPTPSKTVRKPSLPTPFTAVVIELTKPLKPLTPYRLQARGLKSITGRWKDSDRSFTTPKPPPPPAPRDTTSRPRPATKKP